MEEDARHFELSHLRAADQRADRLHSVDVVVKLDFVIAQLQRREIGNGALLFGEDHVQAGDLFADHRGLVEAADAFHNHR